MYIGSNFHFFTMSFWLPEMELISNEISKKWMKYSHLNNLSFILYYSKLSEKLQEGSKVRQLWMEVLFLNKVLFFFHGQISENERRGNVSTPSF